MRPSLEAGLLVAADEVDRDFPKQRADATPAHRDPKDHPRTLHIDPTGRPLVGQHNLPVSAQDGDAVKNLTAGLSVFRIGDDGKLTFVRKYLLVDEI